VILAATDYLQYRFQKGQYSPRTLEAEGWFLADSSSFDKLKTVRDGDILFSQPTQSFTSWVVMYFQGGPCSHVAMLTKEGTVIEAISSGVVERPADVYFDGKHFLTIRRHREWNEELGQKLVSFQRSQIGRGYASRKVIVLGFHILIGNHWNRRLRLSIDILTVLAALWLISYRLPSLQAAILVLAALYSMAVIVIRLKSHPAPYETTVTGDYPQAPLR
jgi:hypothetical protein